MNFPNFFNSNQVIDLNSKIAILGYGTEGKSTEAYLKKHHYKNIVVLDENENITAYSPQITGASIWSKLNEFDLIFRSPGISPLRPELQSVLSRLTSQMEWFFQFCPVPIIAVTGTKGKGTTTTLIKEIIKHNGEKCFIGGNIGEPVLNFLDEIKLNDKVVIEISSFQSFTLHKSPHIAIILMVTQDHLDYHLNIEEYVLAKAQLVKNQSTNDYCIYHYDFSNSQQIALNSPANLISFSPKFTQSNFAYIKDQAIYYNNEFIMPTADIGLIGSHNFNNVLASVNTAKLLNIPNQVIADTVKSFTGLPLRLEMIAKTENIIFINDSFSTTPETSIAAINSFIPQPIFIFLGGYSKNSDFIELGNLISNTNNIIAICYGDEGPKISQSIKDKTKFILVDNLTSAFNKAVSLLKKQKTSVFLLSPACASFDQFKNYKDRGLFFNLLVKDYIKK